MTRPRALLAPVLAAALCTMTACAFFDEARGLTAPTPASQTPSVAATTDSPSSSPDAKPTPTPKATPKDEVTQAVYRYYRVLDELGQKPPRDPYRKLNTITSGEAFDMWQDEMIRWSFDDLRQTGSTKITWTKHGKITKKDGQRRVVVQTCIDVSGIDVLDKKGKSIVPKDRPDRAGEKLWMSTEDGSWYVNKSRDGSWKC